MQNKILAGLLFACAITTTSCQDFLTENPMGRIVNDSYFSSQSDLDGTVNVLYARVQNSLGGTSPLSPNWMGDDITAQTGGNKADFREFDSFSANDNNSKNQSAWNTNYAIIKAANFIIENADRTPVSKENIEIAKGQALFWRAFAYFKLVRWYGDIPLVLTTNIDFNISKTKVEDIYKQICQDLSDAVNMLPAKYEKKGDTPFVGEDGLYNYVNKGAAQSVLAAVYMARAGYPLMQTEYYEKAAEMARFVIDGVEKNEYYYVFEDTYKNKFNYATNNGSKEMIIGIKFNKDNPWGWSGLDCQLPRSMAFEDITSGWGDALGEIKFFNDMPAGPRKDVIYGKDNGKIFIEKGNSEGTKADWFNKDIVKDSHPMLRTLLCGGNGNGHAELTDYNDDSYVYNNDLSNQTLRVLSYSEVLLWYAEAAARTNKIDQKAIDALQKVLDRAYGKDASGIEKAQTLSSEPEKFAEVCVREHGYEVAGYFPALVARVNDQLRTNTLKDAFAIRQANAPVTVVGTENTEVSEGITVTGSWSEERNYLVIPAFDTKLNDSLNK